MSGDSFGKREAERRAISFRNWKEVLGQVRLSEETRLEVEQAVLGFLRFCKGKRVPASVTIAKLYIEEREAQAGRRDEALRAGLRWFVTNGARSVGLQASLATPAAPDREVVVGSGRAGLSRTANQGSSDGRGRVLRHEAQAAPAASDLGGADWEWDLIVAMRERHFLFRTESTYREWAHAFAAFLRPRSPYAATGADIGAFLSEQAVTQRAAPSTQKQALNALVFVTKLPEGTRSVTLRSAAGQALTQTAA